MDERYWHRHLPRHRRDENRLAAVRAVVEDGLPIYVAAERHGMHRKHLGKWVQKWRSGNGSTCSSGGGSRGRRPAKRTTQSSSPPPSPTQSWDVLREATRGTKPLLPATPENRCRVLKALEPHQGTAFTVRRIGQILKREGIDCPASVPGLWQSLKQLKLSCQKPAVRARQQKLPEVRRWRNQRLPALKKRPAENRPS